MTTAFYLADGRVIEDLDGLRAILPTLDDKLFTHHVNQERNDFANWVEGVFSDPVLAEKLRKARKRRAMINIFQDIKKKEIESVLSKENVFSSKKKPVKKSVRKKVKDVTKKKVTSVSPKKTRGKSSCVVEIETESKLKFAIIEFIIGLVIGFAAGALLVSL